MAQRFSADESARQRATLHNWQHDPVRDAISRRFDFADFVQAFGFMTQLALAAERLNHHPDLRIGWGRVEVRWTSHDTGGVTARDAEAAQASDRLAAELGARPAAPAA